jgi:hypothetical protein
MANQNRVSDGGTGGDGGAITPGRRLSPMDGLRAGAQAAQCDTLADLVLSRTKNPVTAVHVISYIALWGSLYEKTGKSLMPQGLIQTSGRSHATIYRWHNKFRATFPELADPAPLWSLIDRPAHVPEDVDAAAYVVGAAPLAVP